VTSPKSTGNKRIVTKKGQDQKPRQSARKRNSAGHDEVVLDQREIRDSGPHGGKQKKKKKKPQWKRHQRVPASQKNREMFKQPCWNRAPLRAWQRKGE